MLVTLLAHPPEASAASYFVSPDGDDAAAGTSPEGAWKSLGFAGARTYRPGDVLRLEGGETYTGTLAFGADDGGDPEEPVTVAAYGPGRATIRAAAGPGVSIYNAGGFALRDLDVVGPGVSANATNGVNVYADLPGDRLLPGVTIERVTATGFGRAGVAIGSWSGRTGFRDVLVRDVRAHGNRHAGIVTYAQQRAVHRNVVITRSQADGNWASRGST